MVLGLDMRFLGRKMAKENDSRANYMRISIFMLVKSAWLIRNFP
jgi:hypothetical protein